MWHDPLHNHDFIDSMITLAQGDELSAHPSVLPESDAGSNTVETVARSRVRLVEILRACRNEVSVACFHSDHFDVSTRCSGGSYRMRPCTSRRHRLHPCFDAKTFQTRSCTRH
jgi:hypothetical protein